MEFGDRDRLDQWLDRALRQNEIAEPRPGLEGRVLARIAAEAKRHRTLRFGAWILATASAAAVFALIGLDVGHYSGKAPKPAVAPVSRKMVMAGVTGRSVPVSLRPVVRNRAPSERTPSLTRTIAEPKLEHFPSRRPRSQQEHVLVSYAERFPAEAALIAREQGKFDQEIAKAQEEAEKESSRPNQ